MCMRVSFEVGCTLLVEFVYKEPEFQLSVLDFDIFVTFTSPNQNIARSAHTLRTASLSPADPSH